MFVFAPDEPPSRLQAVVEGFVDGILILTELGEWVHANASARRICRQLTLDPVQSTTIPQEIWRVCRSLIESRELYPDQKVVLESEEITQTGATLRIRAQWLQPEISIAPVRHQPDAAISVKPSCYILVVLEDRNQSAKNLADSSARKYGLTLRQAEVWSLRQLGYSYQEIAARLYITLNTVKKHIKDIRAKILEVKLWEECVNSDHRGRRGG